MALSNRSEFHNEEMRLGLGFVKLTQGLGRKRILISKSNTDRVPVLDSSPVKIPLKRQQYEITESNKSTLESLHQDILIRVVCHVNHDDLTRLKRVSKTIRKAVLEAKKSHFDYNTPKKCIPLRDPILSNSNLSEIETPNAPIRRRNIIQESDLSKISMVLFK